MKTNVVSILIFVVITIGILGVNIILSDIFFSKLEEDIINKEKTIKVESTNVVNNKKYYYLDRTINLAYIKTGDEEVVVNLSEDKNLGIELLDGAIGTFITRIQICKDIFNERPSKWNEYNYNIKIYRKYSREEFPDLYVDNVEMAIEKYKIIGTISKDDVMVLNLQVSGENLEQIDKHNVMKELKIYYEYFTGESFIISKDEKSAVSENGKYGFKLENDNKKLNVSLYVI